MKRPPSPIQLRAEMILRGLSLRAAASAAGVEYTRASQVLNGRRNDPQSLSKLRTAILSTPRLEVAA